MIDQKDRRLSTILVLDAVAYSRMMAGDDTGTLNRVLSVRQNILEPAIANFDGRIFKLTGDGLIAEFSSVSNAVGCAEKIQRQLAGSSASHGGDPPLQFRIGIHLGEVIADGDDLYGDGVNVASRIEALAQPGGIAVSAPVFEQVKSRLSGRFTDIGEHEVKNIPLPVRVYQMGSDITGPSDTVAVPHVGNQKTWLILGAVFLVAALIAGWIFWPNSKVPNRSPKQTETRITDKPSVAVMPFDNLSGDPEQTYFSDGMADNLITDLSRIGNLLVIARNTSFSFRERGEAADARSVGTALGVRYVVEGSVQRAGDDIRINANLIDTSTGFQVWAGRLDRKFTDLFALQDQVASQIIAALHVEITQEERRLISKRYTDSLEAYDLYLRAWEEIWRFNDESRQIAQDYLWSALEIDPDFALAKAILATAYTNRTGVSLTTSAESLETAYRLARQAVAIDPDLPAVHASLGLVHMFRREYDKADFAFARAVELDPNFADGFGMQAWNWHYAGDPERALAGLQYALRLNPRAPFPYLNALAEVHFSLGKLEEAMALSVEGLERNPEALRMRLMHAAILAELGRTEDAEWEVLEALALQPGITIANVPDIYPYREGEILARLERALRQAGLPG